MISDRLRRPSFRPILLALCLALAVQSTGATGAERDDQSLKPILSYISNGWDVLTRSMTRCDSVVDPKLAAPSVLYLPADFPVPRSVERLQQDCKVNVEHLPTVIHRLGEIDVNKLNPPGLLFLEHPYVVPGGRFNEMYGWDSYFIIRGLLQDGRVELARGMVENFFFEVDHYGAFLNANRTYYLTRSQPPFLSSMVMSVYDAGKAAGHEDNAWLQTAYDHVNRDYQLWVHEPHLAGSTGLARYYDFGDGPPQEGLQDESGLYRKVMAYFLSHPEAADHDVLTLKPGENNPDATAFTFSLQLCESGESPAPGSRCEAIKTLSLSRDFYKGDRSMRESGYDISFRFGPYGAQTHHYAPVCLNSLLYKTEMDLAQMAETLGKKDDAENWRRRAQTRKEAINKYLWDANRGMFFDYDFTTQKRSTYEYVTTFFPLWAGLASPEQASALEKNLPIFEQPGGLVMSRHETGVQWDYPWGWAPTQLPSIEGLRRYGFNEDANRLSYKFLATVLINFQKQGYIVEKYNVVNRTTEATVASGYKMNVVGFGWTNGVFLSLLHALPSQWVEKLANEQAHPAGQGK
jgi:alpha,alpha-trehalase